MDIFCYATRTSATSATMRLHGEIGYDLLSRVFIEELAYLVNDGVTDVEVRIHSVGGNVLDGYGILSELLKCPANVTTVNEGLAASTAGWLLMAGKTVQMADYALFMLHNPSTFDASSKAQEVVAKMRESIVTIIASRSGQTPEKVSDMMNQETWLTAEQCLTLGFITDVIETEQLVALSPDVQNVNTMYQVVNSALGLGAAKNEAAPAAELATEEVTPEATPAAEETAPEAEAAPAEETTPAEKPTTEPEAAPAEPTAAELRQLRALAR